MSLSDIKFRGKRLDDGEWVYGDLLRNGDRFAWIATVDGSYDANKTPKITPIQVDPKAVGQFTGLKDANGTDIYEGDLVLVKESRICEVVFHKEAGCWDLISRNILSSVSIGPVSPASWKFHVKVIGNIHDNPELLGGE